MPSQLSETASSWYSTYLSGIRKIQNEALARDTALRITDLVFEKCFARRWWIFPARAMDEHVCRNAARLYMETSAVVAKEVERNLHEGLLQLPGRN